MPRSAFLDLFDRYGSEILERQRQAAETPVPEAFHQMRVHVKRQRALLELVAAIAPKLRRRRAMRVFREAFQAAGAVRDLHVQIAIATKEAAKLGADVSPWLALLESREKSAVAAWVGSGTRISAEAIAGVRADVGAALDRRRWVDLAAAAWAHFNDRFRDVLAFDAHAADLHELRKRVKECSNLTWIIAEVAPELVIAPELAAALDKLQKQLGDWHDYDVAVQMSSELPTEEPGSFVPEGWLAFRAALEAGRTRLRDKVLHNWAALARLAPPGVRRP